MAKWGPQVIADTLALLEANGGNISLTSRISGVSRRTIRRWRDKYSVSGVPDVVPCAEGVPMGQDMPTQKVISAEGWRERFLAQAVPVAEVLLQLIPEKARREDASLRDVATALGIACDKIAVLIGQPTQVVREEQHILHDFGDAIEQLTDEELRRAIAEVESIIRGSGKGTDATPARNGSPASVEE